jgi:hypothetical protein
VRPATATPAPPGAQLESSEFRISQGQPARPNEANEDQGLLTASIEVGAQGLDLRGADRRAAWSVADSSLLELRSVNRQPRRHLHVRKLT